MFQAKNSQHNLAIQERRVIHQPISRKKLVQLDDEPQKLIPFLPPSRNQHFKASVKTWRLSLVRVPLPIPPQSA
jgi:hypothetical protein